VRKRKMASVLSKQLYKNLHIIRINDTYIKYFEGIWGIPESITYNSYVLRTDEGSVLFDTVKKGFCKEYLEKVDSIVGIDSIKYLIIHHMEPDHSGCIDELLSENNKITIMGHPMTKRLLESLYGISHNFRVVKDGEKISIGDTTLEFFYNPWLHWPETISTFILDIGALLTCDVFGGYSIPKGITDGDVVEKEIEEYFYFMRKYFATVIGHYHNFVSKNLDKMDERGIKPYIIAPSHGLVWIKPENIARVFQCYRAWSQGKSCSKERKAVALYTTMYGYIRKMVNAVLEELKDKGYVINVYEYSDISWSQLSDALGDALDAEIVIVGAATYEAGLSPLAKMLIEALETKLPPEKNIIFITTYGWGPSAGKIASEKLSKKTKKLTIIETKPPTKKKSLEEIKEKVRETLGKTD
jgi:flavorubredoxin